MRKVCKKEREDKLQNEKQGDNVQKMVQGYVWRRCQRKVSQRNAGRTYLQKVLRQGIALGISAVMVVSLIGIEDAFSIGQNIMAAEMVQEGTLSVTASWQLDADGVLTITGTGAISGSGRFQNYDVKEVVISSGITAIGNGLFRGCSKLVRAQLPDTLNDFGDYVFDGCTTLERITISDDNTSFVTVDGILFDKTKRTLLVYPAAKTAANYVVPQSVEKIADEAFAGAQALTDVVLQENVSTIGEGAWNDCIHLQTITIYNPECSMGELVQKALAHYNKEMTVAGYAGSTAEDCANLYGWKFTTLAEKTVTSIEVLTPPKKTVFALNDNFSSVGLEILVRFSDETTLVRSTGFEVTGFDNLKLGSQDITVSYQGVQTTYSVEVVRRLETPTIQQGVWTAVDIVEPGQVYYFVFTPETTDFYDFYGRSDSDTYGAIYNNKRNLLLDNDDREDDEAYVLDFGMTYVLEAKKTYYLAAKYQDDTEVGSFDVVVKLHGTDAKIAGPTGLAISRYDGDIFAVLFHPVEGAVDYALYVDGERVTNVYNGALFDASVLNTGVHRVQITAITTEGESALSDAVEIVVEHGADETTTEETTEEIVPGTDAAETTTEEIVSGTDDVETTAETGETGTEQTTVSSGETEVSQAVEPSVAEQNTTSQSDIVESTKMSEETTQSSGETTTQPFGEEKVTGPQGVAIIRQSADSFLVQFVAVEDAAGYRLYVDGIFVKEIANGDVIDASEWSIGTHQVQISAMTSQGESELSEAVELVVEHGVETITNPSTTAADATSEQETTLRDATTEVPMTDNDAATKTTDTTTSAATTVADTTLENQTTGTDTTTNAAITATTLTDITTQNPTTVTDTTTNAATTLADATTEVSTTETTTTDTTTTVPATTNPEQEMTTIATVNSVAPGVPVEAVEQFILGMNNDSDPAGSAYHLLQAKATKAKKKSIKVTWKKVAGAKGYVVYGNRCGKGNRYQKIATVTKNTWTQKKLKKGTYYKYLVVAYDKDGKVLSTSKTIHVATTGGKVGNPKQVKTRAKKNKVVLKVKKTFKLKGKVVPKSKKLKVKKHRVVKYETTNTKVATVNKKGVIKAKAKGTCFIYAYAQNGVCRKIKVTVK